MPLRELVGPGPEWQELALCAQTDPEAFYPDRGSNAAPAKRICRRCDVRQECLEDALAKDDQYGVRGGLSENERKRLKRKAALQRKAA